MSKHFLVSDGINQLGPFSANEILQMLGASYISMKDLIVDTRTNQLRPIHQHPEFKTVSTGDSARFYVGLNGKEYGPVKFLFILSLLQSHKLDLQSKARLENDLVWQRVENFVSKDVLHAIAFTPLVSDEKLAKARWKRKNIRIDYEENVLLNNSNHTLVAKAMDLSSEAIALIWAHSVPENEEFELSLLDKEKRIHKIKAILTRKEILSDEGLAPIYKAVFTFTEKLQMKHFIE